jgi:hypothetical protein
VVLVGEQGEVEAEYQRRTAAERSADGQRRAVARGVVPFPNAPAGYRRGEDGVLQPHRKEAPIIAQAFELRAGGATIKAVREYLRANGIERTYHGVQHLLKSRLMVGEIHFGELVNLRAHEPIIDADTFRRVQSMSGRRGRRPSSDRLLARLGVLRCAACGARMVVGVQTQNGRRYPFYRCPPTGDCKSRVTIGAEIVETAIVERVQSILAGVEGRASAQDNRKAAEDALERTQDALDAAIRTLADFTDEPATRERLEKLREARDGAQEHLEQMGREPAALTVSADDWPLLTPEGRRALVKATIASVTIGAGRGLERVTINAA